jgi:protein O-mannosyl-transferase
MKKDSLLKIHSIAILLIILAGFFVYANSLGNGFVYDDLLVVEDKPFLSSLGNVKYLFTKEYFVGSGEFTYRPLVTFTYMVDYYFSGDNAFGYHLTNVLLHIANSMLFYWFLINLLPFVFDEKKRKIIPIALLASIIFCIHPVQTETVNAVAFREDLLMVAFAFASLLCFIKSNSFKKPLFCVFSLAFFFMSLQSKETMFVFPILVILTDLTMHKDIGRSFLKRAIRYIPAYVAVIVVYLCINSFWANTLMESAHRTSPEKYCQILGTPFVSLITSARIFVSYIGLFLFPVQLSIERIVVSARSIFEPSIFISSSMLLGLLVYFIYKFRSNRLIFFAGLWFFVSLLPVTNIIPLNHPMAERYLYLPSIGYSLLLAWVIVILYLRKPSIVSKSIVVIVAILLVGSYSLRTVMRNYDWKDNFSLWYKEIMNPPSSARAYTSVAYTYFNKEMYGQAVEYYKRAIEVDPDNREAHNGLGRAYFELAMYDRALKSFQAVIRNGDPDYIHLHNNLGRIYSIQGKYEQAQREFEQVIELDQYHYQAHNNLGTVYFKQGDFAGAARYYAQALELKPSNISIRINLGLAYFKMGDLVRAEETWRGVVEMAPNSPAVHQNLAVLYRKQGRKSLAKEEWTKVLKYNPSHMQAKRQLILLNDEKF